MKGLISCGLLILASLAWTDNSRQRDYYQTPQLVYIGDPAVLIVTLEPDEVRTISSTLQLTTASKAKRTIPIAGTFSPRPDVSILGIELANHAETDLAAELRISFTAYSTGQLALPTLELAGLRLDGLWLELTSALVDDDYKLAAATGVRLVPGTLALVYALAFTLLLLIATAVWAATRGRKQLAFWTERRIKRQAYRRLGRLVQELKKHRQTADAFMDRLTPALRSFLTVHSGLDFLALTAPEVAEAVGQSWLLKPELAAFLTTFFHRSDQLRFGRQPAKAGELTAFLQGTEELITLFYDRRPKEIA